MFIACLIENRAQEALFTRRGEGVRGHATPEKF